MRLMNLILLVALLMVNAVSAAPTVPPVITPDHPLYAFTIAGMRTRDYPGGEIHIRALLEQTGTYSRFSFDYPSDGLTITGILQVPPGPGPFPVIILNHGFIPQDEYWSGLGSWQAANFLNRHGYMTLAPDYRSWGESDIAPSLFHGGLVVDVLNLISALPSLPQADAGRVGMWGHSMGGGITTKVLTIDPRVRAAVLYAPNSAYDADIISRWGPGCHPDDPGRIAPYCNQAEIVPADISPVLFDAYAAAVYDPLIIDLVSPIKHLQYVNAPVQIHIGTADSVTPPVWAQTLYEALLSAGKDAEIFWYQDQDHSFQDPAWVRFMNRAAAFFDLHVRGAA